jgi:hypothetical protein
MSHSRVLNMTGDLGSDAVRAALTPPHCRRALGGLFVRRESWSLSLRGKLAVAAVVVVSGVLSLRGMFHFLAVTDPVPAEVLILEAWVPTYTVSQVAIEFKRGGYQDILVVRALYTEMSKYETGEYLADYIAQQLVDLGVPKERVHTVFLDATHRDRTYASAVAAGKWLEQRGTRPNAFNILTLGAHARRSRLLYRKAMDNRVVIGVVSLKDRSYDPKEWWRTSEGVREVPFEFIAYLYARFLFHAV